MGGRLAGPGRAWWRVGYGVGMAGAGAVAVLARTLNILVVMQQHADQMP
jgi:hypothetical protein